MKKLIIFLIPFLIAISTTVQSAEPPNVAKKQTTETVFFESSKEQVDKISLCPKTLMKDSCLTCHQSPSFALRPEKEKPLFETFDPPSMVRWVMGDEPYLRFDLHGSVDTYSTGRLRSMFEYAHQHKAKKVVIDIMSGGGLMFEGWQIIGMMAEWKQKGLIVETRAYSFTGSAASLIFAGGSSGYRKVSPTAQLMFHELWTFKMFAIEDPSSSEEEARILRHLQDTGTQWLSERSKLTKDQWDLEMKKKDFWMNGSQAVEKYGIADGYL